MPSPLEDLGGITPPPFHTLKYPNNENMLVLVVSKFIGFDDFLYLYNSLQHNKVFIVLVRISPSEPPQQIELLQYLHPYVQLIDETADMNQMATRLSEVYGLNLNFFFHECPPGTIIHPKFWDILKTAEQKTIYTFQDDEGASKELWCQDASQTRNLNTIASYAKSFKYLRKVDYVVGEALATATRTTIQEITVDTTRLFTPLCALAVKYRTDKSPYNSMGHRHPYTGVYSMFLSPYRHKSSSLKLGEIGILNGSSVKMWRDYFPGAELHAFDVGQDLLDKIKTIPGLSTHYMNVNEPQEMNTIFQKVCANGKRFDILIEDTTHCLEHQLLVIQEATKWLNPGGLLVIEDIFRDIPTSRFQEAIDLIGERVESAVMVTTDHRFRQSGPWNNDRLLFIWVK